jgi:ferredoxin-NADP reductase
MDPDIVMVARRLITSRPEAGNVRTFVFDAGGLAWVAGQSMAWVLPQAGATEDERQHWFTISSAPSEKTVNISTRVSASRFKQALAALVPGETILTHSLEGDFTWEDASSPVVLVAGGIGITPFRSILAERQALGRPLNATLLYFNRTDEIPFLAELEAAAARHPEFTLRPVVGDAITADRIVALAPEARDRLVYLSGPEPMVEAVGADLGALGITIKQDWFPGYDDKNY